MRKPQQCYIFHQGAYERTEHCPTRIWQQQWIQVTDAIRYTSYRELLFV